MSIEKQLDLKFPIFWSDFAIEKKFANLLIYKIITKRPKNIVELGSGLSTLLTLKTLKKLGYEFFFYSFDSDKSFLEETKNLLISEGLEINQQINLIYSDIKQISIMGTDYKWYEPSNFIFKFSKIDLLVIDGPIGTLCKNARYPAIPILKKYLQRGSMVLLDDANREDEEFIVDAWRKENPEILSISHINSDRGAAEISF